MTSSSLPPAQTELAGNSATGSAHNSVNDVAENAHESVGPLRLFLTFSRIALSGFGGVLPFFYRAMVEQHKWLTPSEVAELVAFGQLLPGPTICNVALMVGYNKAGLRGSLAALAGMIVVPMLIILLVGVAYTHYGEIEAIQHALAGMSAVAAGLIFGIGLKMMLALPRRWLYGLFMVLEFVGVAVLRWPLIFMVLGLAPFSVWLAYRSKADA
jgi:chromate transporter